ncbi:MAG: DUF2339 domain-containing protein [Bacteroidales bacterium]|nr:DUF2339 domain-containing protein [Bacteroidales bacterium]
MASIDNRLNSLQQKLEALVEKQTEFAHQINELKHEIGIFSENPIIKDDTSEHLQEKIVETKEPREPKYPANPTPTNNTQDYGKPKRNLERFIGENLISKIGIIITIIGVAIGIKYAVEHQFISPVIRVILGYLVGTILLGFAYKLKREYESFSAVLLSGSSAIMYFITFAAYSFYGIYAQWFAFALMLAFTAFTVAAALKYNQQVIAHIGLVGAYAIPFLVSTGSGKAELLFAYMAIINVGILAISIKKYWKPVYFSSLGFTWLIYLAWLLFSYRHAEHFTMASGFLLVFFIIFYSSFLIFKLLKKESFATSDIILLLANSFLFYFFGYYMLSKTPSLEAYTGLFTLCNALLHTAVGILIFRQKQTDKNLFFFVLGLALAFFTIAIPVQLDGNWVTLLWTIEGVTLFWIGRTRGVAFYEKLAFPLLSIAFVSIIHDWGVQLSNLDINLYTPFFNINFYSSLATTLLFALIIALSISKRYSAPEFKVTYYRVFAQYFLPLMFGIIAYFTFAIEIYSYWTQQYSVSMLLIPTSDPEVQTQLFNASLLHYRTIWLANHSLLFFGITAYLASLRKKNEQLGKILLVLIPVTIGIFLGRGLHLFSELRTLYLDHDTTFEITRNSMHIAIRYISFAFLAVAILGCRKLIVGHNLSKKVAIEFDICLHIILVWVLSSELISWMDLANSPHSYKLGMSILWGIYSLFLIAIGLWKGRRHLRIGAITLLAITLVKLFIYDIAHLNTLSKVIVLLSLGVLLLIISFLYNKYKHLIINSDE